MKRRCDQHDYRERSIYMVTLATEGRRPLFGHLTGNPDITEGPEAPHVVLTTLGERVKDCWTDIPKHHPDVSLLGLCIMPEHIHGILFIHRHTETHLGHIIEGFKTGTRKAARELGLLPQAPSTSGPVNCATSAVNQTGNPSRHTAAGRAHGILWEPGYHDRFPPGKTHLPRMPAYLNDNPRRLLLKRRHPEFFTRLGTLSVANTTMDAMGNRFLLDNPTKLQVQCSRSLTAEEIEQRKTTLLNAGRDGAVLVSPCISPGEQQIATAAMEAGIPLIVLLLNGFPEHFKPKPRYLEACADGRLLMLTPFPHQNEKIDHLRQRCLQLNALAKAICQEE